MSDQGPDWGKGLLPAVVQDYISGNVLMLGYINEESWKATLEHKKVTFYSRSRQELWQKGETSGNFLDLVSWSIDCDNDTFLLQVIPQGPACHNGTVSCFEAVPFLSELANLIGARRGDVSDSYTSKLLNGDRSFVAQKVGEEGVELALASVAQSSERVASEAADLLYHYLVLLEANELVLSDVVLELRERRLSSDSSS